MQLRVQARIDGQVLDLQPTGYNNLSQYVFIVYDNKYDYFLSIQLYYLLHKKGMKQVQNIPHYYDVGFLISYKTCLTGHCISRDYFQMEIFDFTFM